MRVNSSLLRSSLVIIFAIVLLYQGCGSDFVVGGLPVVASAPENNDESGADTGTETDDDPAICEQDLKALFEESFYPFLRDACKSCHISGGVGKGAFASADSTQAFSAFQLATATKIQTNALNPLHAATATGPQNQEAVASAMSKWQNPPACDSDDADAGGDEMVTVGDRTIEKLIQATTTNKTLYWYLDTQLASGEMDTGGARVSVQIRTATISSGEKVYLLSNPSLTTGSKALRIGKISVRVNGADITVGTTYSRLDQQVQVNQTNSVLSTATLVFAYPVADTDRLGLSLGVLEVVP